MEGRFSASAPFPDAEFTDPEPIWPLCVNALVRQEPGQWRPADALGAVST